MTFLRIFLASIFISFRRRGATERKAIERFRMNNLFPIRAGVTKTLKMK